MNAWDVWFRFVHVIFGIPFVQWYPSWAFLFFFPVKSPLLPSTLKSTQYSTFLLLLFLLSTRVCVCARYCTYMKLHIHVCMYYVPRATYLLASCTDMCAHNTAVQNIVTCYCYLLLQCKLFTEAVEVYVYTEATFDCTTHSWCPVTFTNCTSSTILDQHLCSNGPKDTPRTEFFPWAIPNVLVSTNILSLECSLRQRYNRLCGRLHHPCVLCKWCIPVLLHGIASKHCRNSLMQCCTHRSPRQH